jgi:hypothetical protein
VFEANQSFWRCPVGLFMGMLLIGFVLPMLGAVGFSEYQFHHAQKACEHFTVLSDHAAFEQFAMQSGAALGASSFLLDERQSGAIHLVFPALIKRHHACVIYSELGEITDKMVISKEW